MFRLMEEWMYIFCKEHNFIPINPLDKNDGVYLVSGIFPSQDEFKIGLREEKDKTSKGFSARDWYIIKTKEFLYYSKEKEYKYYKM